MIELIGWVWLFAAVVGVIFVGGVVGALCDRCIHRGRRDDQ